MTNLPDPRQHMLKTYRALRWGLFIAGVGLPLVLALGGKIRGLDLQDSMSQYYHADLTYQENSKKQSDLVRKASDINTRANLTEEERKQANDLFRPGAGPLRNWFVGSLFVIGALLIVYRGFLPDENNALNIAGFAAIGVALLPMPWGLERSRLDEWFAGLLPAVPGFQAPSVHYVSAVSLFLGLAYVCFFCGSATLDAGVEAGRLTDEQRRRFRTGYRVCGGAMVAAPVAGLFVSHLPTAGRTSTFWTEAIGVVGFAAYWLVKSIELGKSKVDQMGAEGELEVVPSTSAFTGHKVRSKAARSAGRPEGSHPPKPAAESVG